MSRIHFVGGEKGGVGKSVVTRLLAQYCIDNAMPFSVVDADRSHPAMMRYYAGYTNAGNLDDFEGADPIMQLALDADQRVLVDLPAQSDRFLQHWMVQNGIVELATEHNVQIWFWHVMDDGKDSIGLLQSLFDTYTSSVNYVIVKNMGRGVKFDAFEASDVRQLADELGAKVMTLDELHKPTMHKIDLLNASFWSAINNTTDCLGIIERHRVKVWVRNAYKELARVNA
jgi:hypothetical protein